MQELVKYDAACKALAEAKATDEVLSIRTQAAAMAAAGRIAKNKQLEVDAAEIRLRAERRLGQLILEQKAGVGLATGGTHGGRPSKLGSNREPSFDAPATLKQAGIDKKLSSRAQRLAHVPDDEYEKNLEEWREKVSLEGARVTAKLLKSGQQHERKKANTVIPAIGKYKLVLADPPWEYDFSKSSTRDIENNYPTGTVDEIVNHAPETDENCVLFLWATTAKLPQALEVMAAWGFNYKTSAVWDKQKIGMGYWFRGQHEFLLVGVKGKFSPPDPNNRVSSVFSEKRGEHSAKPDCVYEWIERAFPDTKKLEMYARAPRAGWDRWGNEA